MTVAEHAGWKTNFQENWAPQLLDSFSNESCPMPEAADLAAQQGCSVDTVRRRFTKATGRTLVQAWNEARLELGARILLETQSHSGKHLPIRSIAQRCGYADPLYFSRLFSRHFGIAPRRFANQVQGE
jgi:AraC-like DNA-binding protein